MALWALLLLAAAPAAAAQRLAAGLLAVSVDAASGGYNVTLADSRTGGELLFTSEALRVLYRGAYLSSGDGSLVRVGGSNASAGADGMGAYSRVALSWAAPAHPAFAFTTAFRAYAAAGGDGACALVFEQRFDSGIPATARPASVRDGSGPGHVAAFPALQLRLPPAAPALGLLTFQGEFAGAAWSAGTWPPAAAAPPGWVAAPGWDVVPARPNGSYVLHGPAASALACGAACAANASFCAGVYTWSAVTRACY